jgi:hypothetical protein
MATLKTTTAQKFVSANPAVNPHDCVRKQEMDAALAGKASSADLSSAIAGATHDPATVSDGQSVDLEIAGQQITAEVRLPGESVYQTAETDR